MDAFSLRPIARIRCDLKTKFGVPRQSGLVEALPAAVVFEPDFRNPDAFRGLDQYSHIWLIWQFSESIRSGWSPTVRPPRLGGNARLGVFATRSPFRPNGLGLSSVRLLNVELQSADGPVLHIAGADLMDNTPIFDIKPYLPYTDAHPEALTHPAFAAFKAPLRVNFPAPLQNRIPPEKRDALIALLAQDPRPSYHADPMRVYGLEFDVFDVQFTVSDGTVTVQAVKQRADPAL